MADGDKDQEGKDSSFMQNSLVHHVFSPTKMVTVGFLVGILYLIGVVLSNYKLALSEVDARIDNHRGLNQRLDKIDWKIESSEKRLDKHDNEIDDLSKAINARRK